MSQSASNHHWPSWPLSVCAGDDRSIQLWSNLSLCWLLWNYRTCLRRSTEDIRALKLLEIIADFLQEVTMLDSTMMGGHVSVAPCWTTTRPPLVAFDTHTHTSAKLHPHLPTSISHHMMLWSLPCLPSWHVESSIYKWCWAPGKSRTEPALLTVNCWLLCGGSSYII